MKHWWIGLVVLFAVTIVAGAGYYGFRTGQPAKESVVTPPTLDVERGDVVQSVTAPGTLVDDGETTLQSQVNGRVEELLVHPGDSVKAGQTLLILGDRRSFETALSEARIALIEAQIALEAQKSGVPLAEARLALTEAQKAFDKADKQRQSKQYSRSTQETLDIARANYIIAEDGVSHAQELYDKMGDRPEDDPVRAEAFSQLAAARQKRDIALANINYLTGRPNDQEIAEADAQLELAKVKLAETQRKVDDLLKDGGPEVTLAEARLSNAEARFQDAKANLDSLEVKAPFAGVISDVQVKKGQSVGAGVGLMVLSNPQNLVAQVTVVEEDFPLVEVGQAADLFFDALPDASVTGKVARVVPKRASADRAIYSLYISLDQLPQKLAEGMTVDASIVISKKEAVLRLPRSVVRARSDGSAVVEVWVNDHVEKRDIQVGLRGDSFVEVLSGLEEGEQVVAR